MRVSSDARSNWVVLALLAWVTFCLNGCSRAKYRIQADRDAYSAIAERNFDPRWSSADPRIEIDPRSRYFDPYDPDRPPMPLDDPASQQYMQLVDGKKGWKHWHDNGVRGDLENPAWWESVGEYVGVNEDGEVQLNVDSALKLAYVHSPSHQSQLETLYLSALDVTAERFRLDTQFFGGYDATYLHQGPLVPSRLTFNETFGRFLVTPAVDGVESNLLTIGRPSSANPALEVQRRFATAGELLVGFANSFVFEFTGGDANLSASLANFTFIQPLLRGAGRDIALEDLTFSERTLLANLRAYGQFRQGFYTQVAIGELGVTGPRRLGSGTNLQSFSGLGGVGGYLGLLQQLQQIRNSEDNLSLQLRTLARLEAFLEVDVIDRVQVEQFRQNIQNDRDALLQSRVFYELALDRYKTSTLGLPPDLPTELDDTLIRQFQLVAPQATAILDSIVALQVRIGQVERDPPPQAMEQLLHDVFPLLEPIGRQLDNAKVDLAGMDEVMLTREQSMTDEEISLFREDRQLLLKSLSDREQEFRQAISGLEGIRRGLSEHQGQATRRALIVWINDVLGLVERAVLVQARARLEMVTVESIELEPRHAVDIALANRLDFMNGRAALVDSWRLVQVRADALQSVLTVTADGDIRTARNNPASFRGSTGSFRAGVEFDAPFTRLLERNDYREALIEYQRSRRGFIQSCDSLHLGLRALIRKTEQLRTSLEIQRRAVSIAIGRVDLTQRQLGAPASRPAPGQPAAQFNPTTAINLLSAQASLRSSQNNFLDVWLNYYAARMRLARELGTLVLDPDGRWLEESAIPGSNPDVSTDQVRGDSDPFIQAPFAESTTITPPDANDHMADFDGSPLH